MQCLCPVVFCCVSETGGQGVPVSHCDWLTSLCLCFCTYTGAGHIIRISSKSWFISLIPFKKWNLYIILIHYTPTDIFQMFIYFNFDDYNWQLRKIPNSVSQKIRILLKTKMRYARPNNAEELKATIRATWASITPQQCHRQIDSMPHHVAAVIQTKGAPTKYYVLYMLIIFMFILFSWPRFLKILSLYWS